MAAKVDLSSQNSGFFVVRSAVAFRSVSGGLFCWEDGGRRQLVTLSKNFILIDLQPQLYDHSPLQATARASSHRIDNARYLNIVVPSTCQSIYWY